MEMFYEGMKNNLAKKKFMGEIWKQYNVKDIEFLTHAEEAQFWTKMAYEIARILRSVKENY